MRKDNSNYLTGLGDTMKLTDILLPFKTKLPIPKTISFIKNKNDEEDEHHDEEKECSKTIKIKSGTATLYNNTSNGIKIKVPIWGYGGKYLGPTIEVHRDKTAIINWVNAVPDTSRQPSIAVKVDFEGADGEIVPQNILGNPVGSEPTMGNNSAAYFSPHQHGGKTAPAYDGGPEDLLRYRQNHLNQYENHQRATMLWYHDHAMHTTRLNVFSGLAGLWIIRDKEEDRLHLPCGDYEIPLIIQDRNLTTLSEDSELLHKVEFGEGPLEFFGP